MKIPFYFEDGHHSDKKAYNNFKRLINVLYFFRIIKKSDSIAIAKKIVNSYLEISPTANRRKKLILTIEELSKELKIKMSKLRNMIFKKEIPYIKIGRLVRFKREDVEKYIVANTKNQQ